jgi:hypothetical protein
MPDSGMPRPTLTIGTISNPTERMADYSCLGTRTEPAAGADVSITMNLVFFASEGEPARNARVWFFPDNVIEDTCTAPCQEVMSSMDFGRATVTARAGGWYAYRVFARPGPTFSTQVVDSAQYNEQAPAAAGGSIDANAVSEQTVRLIPTVFGYTRLPGTTLLAGTVQDCAEEPVRGATFRVYDGATMIMEGALATDTHFAYFNGMETPDADARFTNVDGLYSGVNVPLATSGSNLLRVEAWGRISDGDPEEGVRVGCEAIRVLPDAVTIVNLGPTRSDYPAGHPCAGL